MSVLAGELRPSNLVVQCGSLASIVEGCLGPYGKAVLMERAGGVLVVRDGCELLRALEVGDPVLGAVVRALSERSALLGDGCKASFLLLGRLLSCLHDHLPAGGRGAMAGVVRRLRRLAWGRLREETVRLAARTHPLRGYEALADALAGSSESFFRTKFSKLAAKNLARLASSYLSSRCNNSLELLEEVSRLAGDARPAVVEVHGPPLAESRVVSGFVLTRPFRHLHRGGRDAGGPEGVSLALWAMEVQPVDDGALVEADGDRALLGGLFLGRKTLDARLADLRALGVRVVVSCVHFPDWAVWLCARHGLSLVDMVEAQEWVCLQRRLGLPTIASGRDVHSRSVGRVAAAEPFVAGAATFVRLLGLDAHQIVLCGPTPSQCGQFSRAFRALFRYLDSWLVDSVRFSGAETPPTTSHDGDPTLRRFPDAAEGGLLTDRASAALYSVPQGGFVQLLAKFLVSEDAAGGADGVDRAILSEVLDEIPRLLHGKRHSARRYVELQTELFGRFRRLRNDGLKLVQPGTTSDLGFVGHETPFLLFEILDSVFLSAEFVLRIECIVPSKSRISEFVGRGDGQESDED